MAIEVTNQTYPLCVGVCVWRRNIVRLVITLSLLVGLLLKLVLTVKIFA
jgi:hypothetical protein